MFWRSTDRGVSYSPRQYRADLNGREWSVNVLEDGTLLMPNALLSSDKNFVRWAFSPSSLSLSLSLVYPGPQFERTVLMVSRLL